MKIVMGLGNPGTGYVLTRHNVGMMFVDKLAEFAQRTGDYGWRRYKNIYLFESYDWILVKTANYFMNESGQIVRDLKNSPYPFFSKEGVVTNEFYLVHDDLDLKLGEYKIQFGKGPKVHNGVESVENALATKEFWRIRIGIESRRVEEKGSVSGADFVLQRFRKEEKEILEKLLLRISEEIL